MTSWPADGIEGLIGPSAFRAFFPLVNRLVERTSAAHYEFQDIDLYANNVAEQPTEAMRVYWREMLYRAHLAAAVSLRRNKAWLDGATAALHDRNPLSLAANLRGFIEAAADTNDALAEIPLTLATISASIFAALSGRLDVDVVSPELEDKLIHFAYAKKFRAKDSIPDKYRAKTAAEYVAEFKWFNTPEVVDLYSSLCEYVHPAASSVHMFLDESDERDVTTISHKREPHLALPKELPSILQAVAILAFSPPLITFGTLNYFPTPVLHVQEAAPNVCRGMPLWAKVEKAFRTSSRPQAPPNSR